MKGKSKWHQNKDKVIVIKFIIQNQYQKLAMINENKKLRKQTSVKTDEISMYFVKR